MANYVKAYGESTASDAAGAAAVFGGGTALLVGVALLFYFMSKNFRRR